MNTAFDLTLWIIIHSFVHSFIIITFTPSREYYVVIYAHIHALSWNFITIDRTSSNNRQEVLLVWFASRCATVCFTLYRISLAGNEADRPAAPYLWRTYRVSQFRHTFFHLPINSLNLSSARRPHFSVNQKSFHSGLFMAVFDRLFFSNITRPAG